MERPDVDTSFLSIIDDLDFDVAGIKSLENAEPARLAIIDSLTDHLMTFDDADGYDQDEYEATVEVLTEFVNRDFERINGLEIGDRIIAYGDSIAIIIDAITGEENMEFLTPTTRLRGNVAKVAITKIPSESAIWHIYDDLLDEDENDNITTNKYGAVLIIENASISDYEQGLDEDQNDSEIELIPENNLVLLPLNYPGLKLKRQV